MPAWVGGDAGFALSFNGVTSGTYVNLPVISGFSTSAFTFLARAKLAAFPSNNFPALIKLTPASNPYGIFVESTSGIGLVLNNAMSRMIPAASVPRNAYFRVGATYDGTTQKLFLNGALADVAHADSGYLDGSVNSIGRGFSAQIFAGQIDEVRIYNRALSSAEMAQDAFDPFAIYRQPSRWWVALVAAGGSSFSASVSEAMGFSDAPSAAAKFAAAITESAAFADTVSAAAQLKAAITESLALADSPAAGAALLAAIAESLGLSDSPAARKGTTAAIAEALALSDSESVAAAFALAVVETLALTDGLTTTAAFRSAIAESMGFADATDATGGLSTAVRLFLMLLGVR